MSDKSPYKDFGEHGSIATRQKPKRKHFKYAPWSATKKELRVNVLGHIFAPNSQHCDKCGMAIFIAHQENAKCRYALLNKIEKIAPCKRIV